MWLLWALGLELALVCGCALDPPTATGTSIYDLFDTNGTSSEVRLTLQTIKQYYRVDRRQIAYLKFIFEAYDGIATLRTLNPRRGIILFYIAPGCEQDFQSILQDLSKQILIEPLKTIPDQ